MESRPTLPVRLDFATDANAFVQAESLVALGRRVVLQSSTCTATKRDLESIAALIRAHPDAIELRYFGGREPFDARLLDATPMVRSLSVDFVSALTNVECLEALAELRALKLGLASVPRDDLLGRLASRSRLESLSLGPSTSSHYDLAFAVEYPRLAELRLESQSTNIDSLSSVPAIRTLALRDPPESCPLGFVARSSTLRAFELAASRRADVHDLHGSTITELSIDSVSALECVDLESLELRLTALRLEHLQQLERVELSADGARMKTVRAIRCPKLTQLGGLTAQTELEELHLAATGLDLRRLVAAPLPIKLKRFYFKGRNEDDPDALQRLSALGLL